MRLLKKDFFIDNWNINFQKLLHINDNPFLKIEYINYLLDNNFMKNIIYIEEFKI